MTENHYVGASSDTEDEDDPETLDIAAANDQDPEEVEWGHKNSNEQRKEIIRLLAPGPAKEPPQRRWDTSGESSAEPLQGFHREAFVTLQTLRLLAHDFNNENFITIPEDTHIDTDRTPILILAMGLDNVEFVSFIIKNFETHLPRLIDDHDSNKMNVLHYIFKLYFQNALRFEKNAASGRGKQLNLNLKVLSDMVIKLVRVATPESLASPDGQGNTPVHYALDYSFRPIQRRGYDWFSVVKSLVEKSDEVLREMPWNQFNNNDQSPYLYFLDTRERYRKKILGNKADQKRKMEHQSAQGMAIMSQQPTSKMSKDGFKSRKQKSNEPMKPGPTGPPKPKIPLEKENASQEMPPPPIPALGPAHQHMTSKFEPLRSDRAAVTTGQGPESIRRPSIGSLPPSPALSAKQDLRSPISGNKPQLPLANSKSQVSGKASHPPTSRTQLSTQTATTGDSQQSTRRAEDIIQNFLKLFYIGKKADLEARELLYGKTASDKNLYFDATHHRGESTEQVVSVIKQLRQAGGFEDTLSYVKLPVLKMATGIKISHPKQGTKPIANEKKQLKLTPEENPNLGSSSLVAVFDEIAKAGVRNILRLHVEDRSDRPHTDSAIERSIRGCDSTTSNNERHEAIGVELWDWRKVDISVEVIAFAAPGVEHVHLYWSGTQAVLRGWSCDEGIPRLYKSSKRLRRVTLHAHPGFESSLRTKRMVEKFIEDIKLRTRSQVCVDHSFRMSIATTVPVVDNEGSIEIGEASPERQTHVWLESMEKFRRALVDIHYIRLPKGDGPATSNNTEYHELHATQRVKVAVIDDGVDLGKLNWYNNAVQATGLSYCPPVNRNEQPWHSSTNGHGTLMANMIARINPWVSLHVMRIQDGMHPNGTRTIYLESAARAIEDAIIRNVDIISMSWTIKKLVQKGGSGSGQSENETPTHKNNPKQTISSQQRLENAIVNARDKGILLFCCASDEFQAKALDSLPFAAAKDDIFRIGAALSKGQRSASTDDTKAISYFFPGEEVADDWNPRSGRKVDYHDGSSISTALAVGLASLIKYCSLVVVRYYELTNNQSEVTRFSEYADRLGKPENMRSAFNQIWNRCKDRHEDEKFLPVWGIFGEVTDNLKKLKNDKAPNFMDDTIAHVNDLDMIKELGKLVTSLCANVS
ncbi:hypothetical protein GQX73_g4638 [Xylaria multiplex]|uniref:Peptidase S8/S53 domain-containing protein n=1 Tax=Xylaria multiplex TaxID=323545 RepID=A0A7C8IPI0_9PEZI|nr:hypothetical protein GQX73_g4638 [Xylaria multiplex]